MLPSWRWHQQATAPRLTCPSRARLVPTPPLPWDPKPRLSSPHFCSDLLCHPSVTSRHFIYVEDVAAAFLTILHKGVVGETYNIGCEEECTNLEIAERLVKLVKPSANPKDMIIYVADRPFNDVRYYISSKKLMSLGWAPTVELEEGLKRTVEWYSKASLPAGPATESLSLFSPPTQCIPFRRILASQPKLLSPHISSLILTINFHQCASVQSLVLA